MTIITDRSLQKAPDRLIALKGNWEQFKLIQKGCEGNPGARLFYFDGTVEILMPGRPHEIFAQAIGVPEVWFWEDGSLALYHLRSDGYERIDRSELDGLRNLDLDVLKRHILMGETDTGKAMPSFSAYLETL
jgi:hypothetical protein